MPGNTDHIALGHFVATGHLQAVVVDCQHLLGAGVVAQGHLGLVALAHQLGDRGEVGGALAVFGLVGEVLRYAVPAPFVGHQRGGVIQRAGQADQHQHGQHVPGPLGFFLFHERFSDSLVPTLCVGMHPVTLCVTLAKGRGASRAAFPRRAWERSSRGVTPCPSARRCL
ncbi:hypothetical protein D9M71_659660 [compost metagenome]